MSIAKKRSREMKRKKTRKTRRRRRRRGGRRWRRKQNACLSVSAFAFGIFALALSSAGQLASAFIPSSVYKCVCECVCVRESVCAGNNSKSCSRRAAAKTYSVVSDWRHFSPSSSSSFSSFHFGQFIIYFTCPAIIIMFY